MPIAHQHEIKSAKILVKAIFDQMWFRIPAYQRPYIWSSDEVNELLDDLTFAQNEKPDQEYFLGSFVFQSNKAIPAQGQEFDENDLLDGQQRMTTLLLLFACIRDLTKDKFAKEACQKCIHLEKDPYRQIPERSRLIFDIRKEVQDFVNEFVKLEGGTDRNKDLEKIVSSQEDKSLQNMAQAILEIHSFFVPVHGLR